MYGTPGTLTPRADLLGAYNERPVRFTGRIREMITPVRTPGVEGSFPKIAAAQTTRVESTRVAKGGAYPRSDFTTTDGVYKLAAFGHEQTITPLDRVKYKDAMPQLEQFMANLALDIMYRGEEVDGITKMLNTTKRPVNTGTLGHTAAVPWATSATGDAAVDAAKANTNFRANAAGIGPNFVAMNRAAMQSMSLQAAMLNRVRYTQRAGMLLPLDFIAEIFQVDECIIVDEYKNTAKEGQTGVFSTVWSDSYVFLGRRGFNPDDLAEPAFARTMYYDGPMAEMLGGLGMVESYGEDPTKQDVVRAYSAIQQNEIDDRLGYLIKID